MIAASTMKLLATLRHEEIILLQPGAKPGNHRPKRQPLRSVSKLGMPRYSPCCPAFVPRPPLLAPRHGRPEPIVKDDASADEQAASPAYTCAHRVSRDIFTATKGMERLQRSLWSACATCCDADRQLCFCPRLLACRRSKVCRFRRRKSWMPCH